MHGQQNAKISVDVANAISINIHNHSEFTCQYFCLYQYMSQEIWNACIYKVASCKQLLSTRTDREDNPDKSNYVPQYN